MKKIFSSSLIILSMSLTPTLATPIAQTLAQTQNQTAELQQLLERAKNQPPQQAIAIYEQALTLARKLKSKKAEAVALISIGFNYINLGENQLALNYLNQALTAFKAINAPAGVATTLNNIGAVYANLGQPQKALESYNASLTLSKEIGDRAGIASTFNNIGEVYQDFGQPQKALEYYNWALPLLKGAGDRPNFATTLSNIGGVYRKIGEPSKAIEVFNQALQIRKEIGDKSGAVAILNKLGASYYATGENQKAIVTFNEALTILKTTDDSASIATTLNNLGEVYNVSGQPQKALELFNQALVTYREIGDRSSMGLILNNIGSIYYATGQPQKALNAYNEALSLVKAAGDTATQGTIFNSIGEAYNVIGQPQKALAFFQQALTIRRQVKDLRGEAVSLVNIASVYHSLGQPESALKFENSALTIAQKIGDFLQEANTLNNIGGTYSDLNKPQSALRFYNLALAIFKQAGNAREQAISLSNIGGIYTQIKQPQKALEFYNSSLKISTAISDRSGAAITLNNIGSVYRVLNQPAQAIANFEKSVQAILQIRSGLERVNRQQFLANNQYVGVGLIDLFISQNQPERAYEWVNLTTTADLLDYSRLINAKVANPQAQQAIEQWNQSNRQLDTLSQQLQANFSPQLSAKVNQLQTKINQQAETIARQFPEVAELFETKPVDIARLRTNISQDTIIIQPVMLTGNADIQDAIALFVLTKNKLTVTKLPFNPKTFDTLVTQYRSQLTDARFPKRFRATSTNLYDILIRPLEAQIQAAAPKQISIIATGKLRYIPFETLIDSKTGKYLIEKYPINNLTRLSGRTTLQPLNNKRKSILAFGNPSPNDGRNLVGAEQEVKSIMPILPGSEAYLEKQATLNTFLTQAPRFSILHLATHGCFQPQGCPDLKLEANTLLFSARNLNIADAALLGLKNTDLVVLSACQTAVQANSNGEEFAGIAYLFERAGASSVIASLWLAKDEETKELMIKFYQNLKQGKTKAEALRQAKLSLISKHPLYWSPFILIGDAR